MYEVEMRQNKVYFLNMKFHEINNMYGVVSTVFFVIFFYDNITLLCAFEMRLP